MRRFRCIADCMFMGQVRRKGFEASANDDQLKMSTYQRLLSKASFIEITENQPVDSELSPAAQAELDMLRGRCKELHIQFNSSAGAEDLKALLSIGTNPGAGAGAGTTEFVLPTAAEVGELDIDGIKAALKGAGVPFQHNTGEDKLRKRLLDEIAVTNLM